MPTVVSRSTVLARVALAVMALGLASCGGGGSSESPSSPEPFEALPVRLGEGTLRDGTPLPQADATQVGDHDNGELVVAIYSFDLSDLDDVESAVLHLQRVVNVGDPWALGPLVVEHIEGDGVLDASDAGAPILSRLVLTEQDAWDADVTSMVKADLAAERTLSTFRLRLFSAPSSNHQFDYVEIGSSFSNASSVWPTLTGLHVAP